MVPFLLVFLVPFLHICQQSADDDLDGIIPLSQVSTNGPGDSIDQDPFCIKHRKDPDQRYVDLENIDGRSTRV